MFRRTKDSSKVSSKCRHRIELRRFRLHKDLLGKVFSWVLPGRFRKGCVTSYRARDVTSYRTMKCGHSISSVWL